MWSGPGSKVGSKYRFLTASTNEAYCPTLKGQVKSELTDEIGSVLEIVIDGLDEESITEAMRVGIQATCSFGPNKGIYRISAGNYGGNLGSIFVPSQKNHVMTPLSFKLRFKPRFTLDMSPITPG